MFQSIWDDVKREFQYGNMISRLIIVNASVFVVFNLVKLFMRIGNGGLLFDDFIRFFSMPQNPVYLLTHPWTLLTSGFTHMDFGHIFWNMLSLYWFGRIVGDLLGNHRILPLYFLGVITGNLVFFAQANLLGDIGAYMLGASGAVMAMVACAAFVAPDYIFNLLFIGPVKLKYIALVLIFLDVIAISDNFNAGGHFAHLGGAAIGLLYASNLRKGIDIGRPINVVINFFNNLFFQKKKSSTFTYQKGEKTYARSEKRNQSKEGKAHRKSDTEGGSDQEKLDNILDKIKEHGYESLSKEEKDFLFKASKK